MTDERTFLDKVTGSAIGEVSNNRLQLTRGSRRCRAVSKLALGLDLGQRFTDCGVIQYPGHLPLSQIDQLRGLMSNLKLRADPIGEGPLFDYVNAEGGKVPSEPFDGLQSRRGQGALRGMFVDLAVLGKHLGAKAL